MPAQPSHSSRFHYGWIVLIFATLAGFGAVGLGRFGYTMVLPSMQASLGIENAQAGLLATANLVGYLAMSAFGGFLATRFGYRLVIASGLLLVGLSMLFTGISHSLWSVALWRAVTGIGAGMANVAAMSMPSTWFAKNRRGLASCIAVSGCSLGLILSGSLVPALLSAYGPSAWRTNWLIFGSICLILAVLAYLAVRNRPSDLGLAPVGAEAANSSLPAVSQAAPLSAIYRSGRVWFLGLTYFAFGFSYIIFITFFAKHLMAAASYTKAAAGSLFMLIGWLSLACTFIWGAISDRLGRKWTLMIIFLLQAACFALFTRTASPALLTISSIIFGVTGWSIAAIISAACGDVIGPRLAPAALGFITVFLGIGMASGPAVAGAMADAAGSFTPALLMASSVALLGAIMSALLRTEPASPR